ncbi:MAG: hypothetical protein ACT4N8_01140 [Sphingosinicella sp.]|uniref:hypothetical protein n=1 Tax=Sphingosinicella sp. TaxID=1917971 RepID=UPI0040379828
MERVMLGAGLHSEGWLQQLLFDHPDLLPVADIEPGFGLPVAIARELSCGHGSIDNLYLTPSGEIILVEAKLWRNPQARREVIAQALDYVAALMAMSYEAFETAVLRARHAGASSLYGFVAGCDEALEEARFIDAISRNLARGRMLVIALGDGIRQEAQALAGLLQSHAGAHFTFALVELATWKNVATGELIAIPNTLAQTVMIERGIVVVEDQAAIIRPVPAEMAAASGPKSISEELFYEEISRREPKLPAAIRVFIASLAPLGVYPEFLASLNLKVDLPDRPKPVNLGYIRRSGRVRTSPAAWHAPLDAALRYNQALADAIGGTVARTDALYVSTDGVSEPYVDQILPAHADLWRGAIERFIGEVQAGGEGS